MSRSLGPALAITGVTLFNDVVLNEVSVDREQRVVVAGIVIAVSLSLVEQIAPELAIGIAWLGLVTVLLVRTDPKVPSPLESFANWYNKK